MGSREAADFNRVRAGPLPLPADQIVDARYSVDMLLSCGCRILWKLTMACMTELRHRCIRGLYEDGK